MDKLERELLKRKEHALEDELREVRKQLTKDYNDKILSTIEENKVYFGKWFKDQNGNYYFPTRPVRVEWSLKRNYYSTDRLQGIIIMPKEVKNYQMDDFISFDDISRYFLDTKCTEVPLEEVLLVFQDSLVESLTVGKNYTPNL